MPLAREGIREMILATVVLGAAGVGLAFVHWAAVLVPVIIWIWAISFFRDPIREATFRAGELCAPADGTVTEVSRVEHDDDIGGPALKVGIFLSIFNVHANRSPCDARVVETRYQPGKYLDARHPDSGRLNESNTLVLEVAPPHAGPVVVRQVAGMIARRIICHATTGTRLRRGERFGMIKFGSRTELIVPDTPGTDVAVRLGDNVKAGLTVMIRQPAEEQNEQPNRGAHDQAHEDTSSRATAAPT
jgi:phosphatidylserine decarboxylase